jgi:hypothetical protein
VTSDKRMSDDPFRKANPMSGRLKIWPPLLLREHDFLVEFLKPPFIKSVSELAEKESSAEGAMTLVRQLLGSGYIREFYPKDSGRQEERSYKASILGLVEGLVSIDELWDRIDDLARNFAEEVPIPFGSWDTFVRASRTGTLKVLAEALLESTKDWKTIGNNFVSELNEAPFLRKDERDRLLKALASMA